MVRLAEEFRDTVASDRFDFDAGRVRGSALLETEIPPRLSARRCNICPRTKVFKLPSQETKTRKERTDAPPTPFRRHAKAVVES